MHEINKCVHMDFNKSYGCTCSTDKDNMNKIQQYTQMEMEYGDSNKPAAVRDEK